jgi:pantoate--beta-alanine ligase
MIIFKKAAQLTHYLEEEKKAGRSVGFVPTMGALHAGHLKLIEQAKQGTQLTVCSIFINPTQFNNPDDFAHYPITTEQDIEKLVHYQCDVLFLPPVSEIYPLAYEKKHYELGPIEHLLEGHYRPGHFQGVCQVMDRLLEFVQPTDLYMGQKDFQQCMVVQKLLELTGRAELCRLHIVPTIREPDGLAMSSRNLRLQPEQRQLATSLFATLQKIQKELTTSSFDKIKQEARERLEGKGFAVDYVEIARQRTLETATSASEPVVALVAAFLGPVRLIDNLLLN